MRILRLLDKPEYWYRPGQVFHRCWEASPFASKGFKDISLSWALTIRCNTCEEIGRAISHYGIYDLVVTEATLRLLEAGGTAIDVGANIGHMTGAMAKAAGPGGRVLAFEPSGRIFPTLAENVRRWGVDRDLARIGIHQCAVSNRTHSGTLYFPGEFANNQGLASLEYADGPSESVQVVMLDDFLDSKLQVSLLKIDVEGHERAVLEGATRLLRERRVRDIIFEDHFPYPSPVHRLLESHGYSLYRLTRRFDGLMLYPASDGRLWYEHPVGVIPNFLATCDPLRAENLLNQRGWKALRD